MKNLILMLNKHTKLWPTQRWKLLYRLIFIHITTMFIRKLTVLNQQNVKKLKYVYFSWTSLILLTIWNVLLCTKIFFLITFLCFYSSFTFFCVSILTLWLIVMFIAFNSQANSDLYSFPKLQYPVSQKIKIQLFNS